jgi:hypothetical protein
MAMDRLPGRLACGSGGTVSYAFRANIYHFFNKRALFYYLKGLSITPSLCIAKMHTAVHKCTI